MVQHISKLGILILIVALLSHPVYSLGNPPDIEWEYTFDEKEGYFQRIIPLGEGYLAVGDLYTYGIWNYDLCFVQLDHHGTRIGENIVQTGESGYSFHLDTTPDGGYILFGDTPNQSPARDSPTDIVLMKVDARGMRQWKKTIGGFFEKGVTTVKVTKDGGFILTGHHERRPYDSDIYIAKTDGSGNVQWDHTIGGDRTDLGIDIALASDGGYAVLGQYCPTYPPGESIPKGVPSHETLYLIKLDPLGTVEWSRFYGDGSGNIGGASVVQADDGSYIIAGTAASLDRYTLHDPSYCDTDLYLVKTSSAGEVIWERRYPSCDIPEYRGETAYDLVLTRDGGGIMAGFTPVPGFGYNATAIKVDSSGMVEWRATYTGFSVQSVIEDSDGSYLISGTKSVKDKLHPWVMKLSAEVAPAAGETPPVAVGTEGPSPSQIATSYTTAAPPPASETGTAIPVMQQVPLLPMTVLIACGIAFLKRGGT